MENNQSYRESAEAREASKMKQPRTSPNRGGKRWEMNELDTEGKSLQPHMKKKQLKEKPKNSRIEERKSMAKKKNEQQTKGMIKKGNKPSGRSQRQKE